jgi:hypothetical protein
MVRSLFLVTIHNSCGQTTNTCVLWITADANRPKDSEERHKRAKRRWAKKHRAETAGGVPLVPGSIKPELDDDVDAEGGIDDQYEDGEIIDHEPEDYRSDDEEISFEDLVQIEDVKPKPKPKPKPVRKAAPKAPIGRPPTKPKRAPQVRRPVVSKREEKKFFEPSSTAMRASVSHESTSTTKDSDGYDDLPRRIIDQSSVNREMQMVEREREREREEAGLYVFYSGRHSGPQQQSQHQQQQLQQAYRQSHHHPSHLQTRQHLQPTASTSREGYSQQSHQQMRYSQPPPSMDYHSDSAPAGRRPTLYPPTTSAFPPHPKHRGVMPRSVSATHPGPSYLEHSSGSIAASVVAGAGGIQDGIVRPQSSAMTNSQSLPTFPSTSTFHAINDAVAAGLTDQHYSDAPRYESMLANYDTVATDSTSASLAPGVATVESKADAANVLMALKTGSRSIGGGSSAPSSPGFYAPARSLPPPTPQTIPASNRLSKRPARDSPPLTNSAPEGGVEDGTDGRSAINPCDSFSPTKKFRSSGVRSVIVAGARPTVNSNGGGDEGISGLTPTPRRTMKNGVDMISGEDVDEEDDDDEIFDDDEVIADRARLARRRGNNQASPSKRRLKSVATIVAERLKGASRTVIDAMEVEEGEPEDGEEEGEEEEVDSEDEDDLGEDLSHRSEHNGSSSTGSFGLSTPAGPSHDSYQRGSFYPSSAASNSALLFHQSHAVSSSGGAQHFLSNNRNRPTNGGVTHDTGSLRDDHFYHSLHLSSAPLLPYSSRTRASAGTGLSSAASRTTISNGSSGNFGGRAAGLITSSPPSAAYLFSSPAHPGISKQLGLTASPGPGVMSGTIRHLDREEDDGSGGVDEMD